MSGEAVACASARGTVYCNPVSKYYLRVAGIGLTTLQRIEQNEGVVKGNFSTVLKIQKALEQAGIQFTDGEAGEIGVRLHIGNR